MTILRLINNFIHILEWHKDNVLMSKPCLDSAHNNLYAKSQLSLTSMVNLMEINRLRLKMRLRVWLGVAGDTHD